MFPQSQAGVPVYIVYLGGSPRKHWREGSEMRPGRDSNPKKVCYQAGYHWGPLGYNPVGERQRGCLSTSCCPSHIEVCLWGYLFSGTSGLPRTWLSMFLGSAERPQAENGGLTGKQPSEVEVRAKAIWVGCPQHLL